MPKRPRLQRYVLLTAAFCLSSFSQARFLLNTQDKAPQSAGFLHGLYFVKTLFWNLFATGERIFYTEMSINFAQVNEC
ncbi:hypothetical protein ACFXTN_009006 [Malus domestica]